MFERIFSSKKSTAAKEAVKEPTGVKIGCNSTTDSGELSCEIREANHVPKKEDNWKVELVRDFIQKWRDHDMEGAKKLVTDDYVIVFDVADDELEFNAFAMECNKIFDAFPDFSFDYDWIKPRSNGTVTLKNMRPRGHHTKAAYAYGPCEPIEATGIYIENAPETSCFHFKNGKICRQVAHAKGDMTGPAGIYTQLGGFPMV